MRSRGGSQSVGRTSPATSRAECTRILGAMGSKDPEKRKANYGTHREEAKARSAACRAAQLGECRAKEAAYSR